MKNSHNISAATRKRLLVVVILSILGVGVLAVAYPRVVAGPAPAFYSY